MQTGSTTAVPPVAADYGARPSLWAWVRLILALAISTVALPYACGRVIIGTMIDWPELHYRIGVVVGGLAVTALTWKLGREFAGPAAPRWLRFIDLILLAVWCILSGIVMALTTGPGLPVW